MSKEFQIEKLRGSSNYHTWKFAVTNYLEMQELEKCIDETKIGLDEKSLKKAKNILSLSVESSIFVHIQNAKTASEIWKTFKRLYEDKGLSRKIGLLRHLISVRLDDCSSMQDYVDKIVSTSNKLTGIGFNISDEWIGAILLAGLTEEYRPLIMGIEASNVAIQGDSIISKLLDNQISERSENQNVFVTKRDTNKNQKYSKNNKNVRQAKCYNCGKKGHISRDCRNKDKPKENQQPREAAKNAFVALKAVENPKYWYLDSGASSHMTPDAGILKNVKKTGVNEIISANNARLSVKVVGDADVDFDGKAVEINGVLHVPELIANLLSISKIVKRGNTVIFDKDGCNIYNQQKEIIAGCQEENGVYKLNTKNSKCLYSPAKSFENNEAMLWHRRLGHLNYKDLCKMRDGVVSGMKFANTNEITLKNCEVCCQGKQTRFPFSASSNQRAENLIELIHSDLCGPMQNVSIGGAKYFLTFLDDHSRKVFVYFIKSKSEVLSKFAEFKKFMENQTGQKIKKFRTDNGGEYVGASFQKFLKERGIQHQTTNSYCPEQNGRAERLNRTIIERAKCLLFDAGLKNDFWAEAVNMAAYLINHSVNSVLKTQTPEEVWTGKKVDVSKIRIFGTKVMVHVPKQKRKKLDPKSNKMIFVGHDPDTKGYRCIDVDTRKLIISRDVIFHENYENYTVTVEEGDGSTMENIPKIDDAVSSENETTIVEISSGDENTDNEGTGIESTDVGSRILDDVSETSENEDHQDPDYIPDSRSNNIEETSRTSNIPALKTRSQAKYPGLNSLLNFAFFIDPGTPKEALESSESSEWKKAMDAEINSHRVNKTWELIKLPLGKKIIKAKWVFKRKRNENGEILKYKARLVAKGCSQRYGIDYMETYSPVVRYTSIRFLIAMAVNEEYKIHQMDVITAYLQGDLDEEIYMEQPEGYNDGSTKACKLQKSVYGLKQAGRQWNIKLNSKLLFFGLIRSKTDPCIYYSKDMKLVIAIYVDDFLIFYKNSKELEKLKKFLNTEFMMKDLGEARSCLGIKITQGTNFIELDQTTYIKEIIHRFGMDGCKPVGTPRDTNQKLSVNDVNETNSVVGQVPYQEAIGSLLFLTQATRPDIAFAVNDVSRFNLNHSNVHWQAVKRIFRYLSGTIDYKLRYSICKRKNVNAFCDADWASEVDARRSCTGYIFNMANGAISWKSARQKTVALSSTEAEYMALSETIQEAAWLIQLSKEMGMIINPLNIHCDNQSAIKLTKSEGYNPRTKHIDIRYHFIREKIKNGEIIVKFLPTTKMVADSLTKPVTKEKNDFCASEMGLIE